MVVDMRRAELLASGADRSLLCVQLSAALERVRAGADIMPQRQLHKQLTDQLGPEWRSKLASFEDEPLAAASIGQVCCQGCRMQGQAHA